MHADTVLINHNSTTKIEQPQTQQYQDKRWGEKITDRFTEKIMDKALGKNKDYIEYKKRREEIERIKTKKY